MRYLFLIICFIPLFAKAQQDTLRPVRIVDSISVSELKERNPLLLRSEIDSLVRIYAPPSTREVEVVKKDLDPLIIAGLALLIALSFYMTWRIRKINSALAGDQKKKIPASASANPIDDNPENTRAADNLGKASKVKDELRQSISQYNQAKADLDKLRKSIQDTYKVRHYPSASKDDGIHPVFETENAVSLYAYNQFLKPLLEITDRNKNHPARISVNDRAEILNLVVSLSLLYIESLYLKVNELSVGGKMVERIGGIAKGQSPDPLLLKKLDTEFGSRALVMNITLEKAGIKQLSYPVFDETLLIIK